MLGGGSFGTAMAAHVAERKAELEVSMLVRDPQVCSSINDNHRNRWVISLLPPFLKFFFSGIFYYYDLEFSWMDFVFTFLWNLVSAYSKLSTFSDCNPLLCFQIFFHVFSWSSKYFSEHQLPGNVTATTDAKAALLGADFCFHAVPVQVCIFCYTLF